MRPLITPALLEEKLPAPPAAGPVLLVPIAPVAPVAARKAVKPAAEPIALVGMGALFPQAEHLQAFWRLVRTGKPAIQLTRSLMLLISSSFFFSLK